MQGLFHDIVEAPAADAAAGARKRQHVRDGVDWEAISRVVATRDPKQCMAKWYAQLRPSMTDTGEWARGDDVKMLVALWRAKPAYVRPIPSFRTPLLLQRHDLLWIRPRTRAQRARIRVLLRSSNKPTEASSVLHRKGQGRVHATSF